MALKFNVPDFRRKAVRHTSHVSTPSTCFAPNAQEFANSMESGNLINTDMVVTDMVSTNGRLPQGPSLCTLYGEPAIAMFGMHKDRHEFTVIICTIEGGDDIEYATRVLRFNGLGEQMAQIVARQMIDMIKLFGSQPEASVQEMTVAQASKLVKEPTTALVLRDQTVHMVPPPVALEFHKVRWAAHAALEYLANGAISGTVVSAEQAREHIKHTILN